ncbi:restriction endonuclease [Peribacillus butanolivorans]
MELAHTPQFYYCYPGRIESIQARNSIRPGHKHLMWCPEMPHEAGVMVEAQTDMVISEIPSLDVYYDSVEIPVGAIEYDLAEDIRRRHAQIQIALITIGQQLGFRTWIAQNDRGIVYRDRRIAEMEGVVASLQNENMIYPYEGAVQSALLIDCIWFKNGRLMPAVMEIEHSTGVTSGLTRMKGLQDAIPPVQTRYVIVAPDELRDKVLKEANRPQFHSLNVKYFPYSAVEELYYLCERRKIRGVTEEFLDSFMEPTLGQYTETIEYN